jgi:hypothetical protein
MRHLCMRGELWVASHACDADRPLTIARRSIPGAAGPAALDAQVCQAVLSRALQELHGAVGGALAYEVLQVMPSGAGRAPEGTHGLSVLAGAWSPPCGTQNSASMLVKICKT